MITTLTISSIVSNNWEEDKIETIIVAIEELAELQKELTKVLRGIGETRHLKEELTDTILMSQALQLIFDIDDSDIQTISALKQERRIKIILDNKSKAINKLFGGSKNE